MRGLGFVAMATLLFLTGCSKNAEAEAFVKENDAVVAEILKAGTPADAKKVFDTKKEGLANAFSPLKDARGFQLSKENSTALMNSIANGATKICTLQISAIGNPAASDAYKSLCDDYSKTFDM